MKSPLIALAVCLLSLPLAAQDADPDAPVPDMVSPEATAPEAEPAAPSADVDSQPKNIVMGEITELAESSFRIRPWAPRLPRRLQVLATPETRYFRHEEGKVRDLKVGELALVVAEKVPGAKREPGAERPDATAKEPKEAAPVKEPGVKQPVKPPTARAVVRFWELGGKEVTQGDRLTALTLLRGALPFFKGWRRGGIDPPGKQTRQVIGVVTSVSPLTLRTANGARVFTPHDDMLLIHPAETKPETLKKGQTVLVHSVTGPTADGSLQALLVAVSPKPRIKPRQQRRIILRERGRPDQP